MFSPFLLPPQKTEGDIKYVKDLGEALDFGAQVFSAVRSGWLSLAVQSCFGEQQHSLQQRLWNTQLRNFCGENISSPFCFPCMKTYWSVHLIVAFKTLVTSEWDIRYSYLLWSVFSSINELWAQTNNLVQCHKDIAVSKTGFKKQNQTITKWSWKKRVLLFQ